MIAELMARLGPVGTHAQCPGCGSGHTAWVRAGEQDNLLCKTCGTCWHDSGSHTSQVDVRTCAGCALRGVCLAAAG